jgi:hypothetical protein
MKKNNFMRIILSPLKTLNFFSPCNFKKLRLLNFLPYHWKILLIAIIGLPEISLAFHDVDSINTITMDNLTQTRGYVIMGTDTVGYYQEFSPDTTGWSTSHSDLAYGGNYRRLISASGSATVSLKINIAKADTYLVYYYHPSGIAPSNAYIKFTNLVDSTLIDSVRYNMLDNRNEAEHRNYWFLLGMIVINSGRPGIDIQLGVVESVSFIRISSDALRLVRSGSSGSDLEFGNRRFSRIEVSTTTGDTVLNHNFFRDRTPIFFPYTIFDWNGYQDKKLMLYNIGSSTLNISNIQFKTSKFSVLETMPLLINPGSKKEITIRFSPTEEGRVNDTILIYSNDERSPSEIMPLTGEGIAYNFILNASLNGIEPHWNVPLTASFYTKLSGWQSSTPSPWPFLILGGNTASIVNTSGNLDCEAIYSFEIPDSMAGEYIIDYSGPAGSSNAAQHATVDLITPSYINPNPALGDTQRVTDVNLRSVQSNKLWIRIGEQTVFQINGGGQTKIRITNPNQGSDLLRADLIRVKKYYPPSSINFDNQHLVPEQFLLLQNFPNPFNPSTIINYSIAKSGLVNISIYDILGRKVTELINEFKEAGSYRVYLDAQGLSSGVYFYRMTCGHFSSTRKMVLVR